MPDGPAAPSVFNATDRTSGPVICSYMTGWDHKAGSQRRQSWTDQQIWLPGASVSVVHRCRSLLLSFSVCYLRILGLEGHFFSSRCMLELKFAIYYRAASLPSQASYTVLAEESL